MALSGRRAEARAVRIALYRDGLLLGWLAGLGLRIGESLTLAQGVSFLIDRTASRLWRRLAHQHDRNERANATGNGPTQLDEHVAYYLRRRRPAPAFRTPTKQPKSLWLARLRRGASATRRPCGITAEPHPTPATAHAVAHGRAPRRSQHWRGQGN